MNRHSISLKQYRLIDLGIFGLILAVSEYLIVTASGRWFPDQLYTVSVTAAVTAIVMMRWGWRTSLIGVLGGLVYVLAQGGDIAQILIYCIGNQLSLIMLFFIRAFGEDRVREDILTTIMYGFGIQILMQIGRGLMAVLMGASAEAIWKFITMDALSEIFTVVIVCIASRQDGILEDQSSYIRRVQEEIQE